MRISVIFAYKEYAPVERAKGHGTSNLQIGTLLGRRKVQNRCLHGDSEGTSFWPRGRVEATQTRCQGSKYARMATIQSGMHVGIMGYNDRWVRKASNEMRDVHRTWQGAEKRGMAVRVKGAEYGQSCTKGAHTFVGTKGRLRTHAYALLLWPRGQH